MAMRLPVAAVALFLCCAVIASVVSFNRFSTREFKLQSSMSLLQERALTRTARMQQLAATVPGLVRCYGFVSCPLGFKIPKNFQLTGQFGGDALTIVDNPDDSFLNVRGMNAPNNDVGYDTAPVANIIRLAAKHQVQQDVFNSHLQSQIAGTDRPRADLAAAPASDADDVVSQFNSFASSVLDSEPAAAAAQKELNEEGWEDEPVLSSARSAHAHSAHEELESQAPLEEGHLERQRRLFTRGLASSMARMLKRKGLKR
jgi:hypothetical protein